MDESHLELSRKENEDETHEGTHDARHGDGACPDGGRRHRIRGQRQRPDPQAAGRRRSPAARSFDAAVASNLGTTTAKLNAAIKAAATARIDAALAAGEITADEATTLKDALADGTIPAIRLATAATVAKELNTTEAKLNAAYASAQKAQAIARVDAALKAGQITETYATELKTKINAADVPGLRRRPRRRPSRPRRSRWAGLRPGLRPAGRLGLVVLER